MDSDCRGGFIGSNEEKIPNLYRIVNTKFSVLILVRVRGGAVGWGTALQTGRPRVQFPMVSHRNEYQEYFLGSKGGWCVGLTTLPPTCADCLEIWKSQPPGILTACRGLYKYGFICTFLTTELLYYDQNFTPLPIIKKAQTHQTCYSIRTFRNLVSEHYAS